MLRPPVRHVNKNPITMIIMLIIFAYCYIANVLFVYLRKLMPYYHYFKPLKILRIFLLIYIIFRSEQISHTIEFHPFWVYFDIPNDDNYE
jgi:hypothetical protein